MTPGPFLIPYAHAPRRRRLWFVPALCSSVVATGIAGRGPTLRWVRVRQSVVAASDAQSQCLQFAPSALSPVTLAGGSVGLPLALTGGGQPLPLTAF